jgi:hydroxyacylglutathione hydrolase
MKLLWIPVLFATCSWAQFPEPDGGNLRPGTLPSVWITGGPNCLEVPDFQVHEYNPDLFILRESGCIHYEKPFLYLFFGSEKALLYDTGAGAAPTGRVVAELMAKWMKRAGRETPMPLVVAHSHAHGDHTAGDAQLKALPNTTVIGTDVTSVQKFFGFQNWPKDIVKFDLGGRVLDVIAIPGHETSSIAIYDRQTGILLTGVRSIQEGCTYAMRRHSRPVLNGWWNSPRTSRWPICWELTLSRAPRRSWTTKSGPPINPMSTAWS